MKTFICINAESPHTHTFVVHLLTSHKEVCASVWPCPLVFTPNVYPVLRTHKGKHLCSQLQAAAAVACFHLMVLGSLLASVVPTKTTRISTFQAQMCFRFWILLVWSACFHRVPFISLWPEGSSPCISRNVLLNGFVAARAPASPLVCWRLEWSMPQSFLFSGQGIPESRSPLVVTVFHSVSNATGGNSVTTVLAAFILEGKGTGLSAPESHESVPLVYPDRWSSECCIVQLYHILTFLT